MGAYKLAETVVELIEDAIKTNIAQALSDIRTERADASVTTEPPREYFRYEEAQVYRPPAVFTIINSQDIRDQSTGANHVNAYSQVDVAVVVEDRIKRLTVLKSWRYQAALMQILHQSALTNTDGSVKVFIRVQRCRFSGIVNIKDDTKPETVFRKEVSLELHVEHVEQLQGV